MAAPGYRARQKAYRRKQREIERSYRQATKALRQQRRQEYLSSWPFGYSDPTARAALLNLERG